MTTITPPRVHHPRASQRLALDPYRVEDMTWTRSEILAARGYAVDGGNPATDAPRPTRHARHRAPCRHG